jgi:hypothetical protein
MHEDNFILTLQHKIFISAYEIDFIRNWVIMITYLYSEICCEFEIFINLRLHYNHLLWKIHLQMINIQYFIIISVLKQWAMSSW